MSQLETCCVCGEPTGRAGVGDGSIYVDLCVDWLPLGPEGPRFGFGETVGPLCCGCYQMAVEAEVLDEP